MTRGFNDDCRFSPLSSRLSSSDENFALNYEAREQSSGVTIVVERRVNYSFIGDKPLVQIESDRFFLETQLTSRVVAFIPEFKLKDYINITLSGNEVDLNNILIYELLEDPSRENYLLTETNED